MALLTVLLAGVGILLLLPSASDLISLVKSGFGGRRRAQTQRPRETASLLFLVPAHNEEMLIGECLASLNRQRYPAGAFDVLVVADNCSDRTAEVARAAGVRCMERDDPSRPGKPEALAWAFSTVELDPYEAVVIIDADTEVDPDFARHIGRVPHLRKRGAQAYNGVRNEDDNSLTRMAALLSHVYYEVAYPLKARARLNVPLTGAGMCLGTDVLRSTGWEAYSGSEDLETYVRLTLRGVRTVCVPEARVRAQEARSLGQAYSQRRRWRGGRLQILRRLGSEILSSGHLSLHQRLDLVSELAAPGPALHAALVASLGGTAVVLQPPALATVMILLAASLPRLMLYTLVALIDDPEPWDTVRAFTFLPVYLVWRLGVEAAGLLGGAPDRWIRTSRHSQGNRPGKESGVSTAG